MIDFIDITIGRNNNDSMGNQTTKTYRIERVDRSLSTECAIYEKSGDEYIFRAVCKDVYRGIDCVLKIEDHFNLVNTR